MNGDDLKQQEEELRQRIELEAEERKLEETLEFQRRMENEAKQKHLAEQHKKATQTYHEKVTEGIYDANLESGSVDLGVHEQFKHSMKVSIICWLLFCFIHSLSYYTFSMKSWMLDII